MPRMKNLDVDFISLVNKGANKQSIKIYKSDEASNSDDEEFRGFFNVLKSFFIKDKKEDIKKEGLITDFQTLVGEAVMEQRIREARWALMDSLENTLEDSTIEDKAAHMSTQIDAFKNYIINTVNTVGIQKSLEQIKEIKKYKEDEDMKPEDIKKMLDEALKPIQDEIKVLKGEEELPEDKKDPVEKEEVKAEAEMLADAIAKATKPLQDELAELKKSRKPSLSIATNASETEAEEEPCYIDAFRKAFEE